MKIAFFASSLVSAYWNGAATYYRGIVRALHERGHEVTFYEPDAYDRQKHRDMADPPWAKVVVYSAQSEAEVLRTVEQARGADLVVKASGVGVHDALLERAVEIPLDQRPDLQRADVVRVVITAGKGIRPDHDPPLHLFAKTFGAAL